MDNEKLWQAVLAQVQLNISPANFNTWFRDTSITSLENGQAVISVPSLFVKGWLEQKYNKAIFKTLRELNIEIKDVKYIVGEQKHKTIKKEYSPFDNDRQPDFFDLKTNKDTNLNSRYTFQNFVVGPFNELPHAAALATAENPGNIYNPLFVYGGVGLGKTHLLQAIGNEVAQKFSDKKVKYVSSEKFTSEVVSSMRNSVNSDAMENIKAKYRNVDVLIMDDVQFLSGKERTQVEFFHTFNHLYEKDKQIILSSDRPPKAISALTERLRSRFEGGMITDISYPDFETRVAILKQKVQEKNISLPDEVIALVASKIQKNIRELEGALNRLLAHYKTNSTLSTDEAMAILKKTLITPTKMVTPKKIIQVVADFYDIKEKTLFASSRKKEVVKPRQIAMFLLRADLKCSFPFIGQKFGGKDHTTAIHSYEKINKGVDVDENLKEEIDLIRQNISSL